MNNAASTMETAMARPRGRLAIVIGVGLILIVVAALAAFLIGRSLQPYSLYASELDPPRPAADFTFLSSDTEQPSSLSDFRGKVVLLYFGYTTCPDVCPATLSDMKQVFELLGKKTEDVQFLWVTVDPDRDTPEKMEDYIRHFNTEFLGLIPPSAEELARVADAYNVYYERYDYGSEAGYLMDHTGSVALIDTVGTWRGVISFNADPKEIAADVEYLLKEAQRSK
jgi:protein SCO1/2